MQEVKTTSERKGKASTWGNDHQIKSVQWSSGLTMTILSSNATSKEFIRLESGNECDNICSTISFHRLSIEAYQARMCCCIWNMQLTFQIQPLELDCMRKHVWICHCCSTYVIFFWFHFEEYHYVTHSVDLWNRVNHVSFFFFSVDFAELAYTMKITEQPDVYSFGVLHWKWSRGSKRFSFLSFVFIFQHEHARVAALLYLLIFARLVIIIWVLNICLHYSLLHKLIVHIMLCRSQFGTKER